MFTFRKIKFNNIKCSKIICNNEKTNSKKKKCITFLYTRTNKVAIKIQPDSLNGIKNVLVLEDDMLRRFDARNMNAILKRNI